MTSERYQQINDLADAVLGMSAAERAVFLERSCAGDQELRERVEELVRAHSSHDTFLQTPLFEVLAKDMANASPRKDLTGQTIGHYEVISRLGAGGIGEPNLGRGYLPQQGLEPLACYTVPTTRDLEDRTSREVTLYRLLPC
jgi:hypothetical protein